VAKRDMIMIGQRFGGYRLEGLATESSIGAVYKARDLRLGRTVSLRIIPPDLARDPITRARLNDELTALAAVDHPNVVPIFEAGEYNGVIFIASRWVDGSALSTLVRNKGAMEPKRAVRLVNAVAWALQAIHALGIIHCNVRPSSVLITPTDHAYLTSFGYARHVSGSRGQPVQDRPLEEYDCLPPEYIAGEAVDTRLDIYGLGCVLYEALTGESPYPCASRAAKVYAHLFSEPPSARLRRPAVPEALDAVIRRATAKHQRDRQQSAGEFAIDAAGALHMSAPPWATTPRPRMASPEDEQVPRRVGPPVARHDEHGSANAEAAHVHRPRSITSATLATRPAEMPVLAQDGYSTPVFFRASRSWRRRWVLWAVGMLLFLAAPALLLVAVADHSSSTGRPTAAASPAPASAPIRERPVSGSGQPFASTPVARNLARGPTTQIIPSFMVLLVSGARTATALTSGHKARERSRSFGDPRCPA
jgi:serine/threonine protein kinase